MIPRLDLEKSTSLHRRPLAGDQPEAELRDLETVIEYAAQILPAEGPITGFAFLNPLHAFEHMPFDEAVKVGTRLFGGQPYLTEERYRDEMRRERIRLGDLQAVLEEDLGARAWENIVGLGSRLSLRMAMLQYPVQSADDAELKWFMAETEALSHFRDDISSQNRNRIFTDTFRWVVREILQRGEDAGPNHVPPAMDDPRRQHLLWPLLERFEIRRIEQWTDAAWETFILQSLWRICWAGVSSVEPAIELPWYGVRPRDVLLEATGVDTDPLVHDVMIRFCASFADQGYAHWNLPQRNAGFYRCFLTLYRGKGGPPDPWRSNLGAELARLEDAQISPIDSIRESLNLLGISRGEWEEFFPTTVLAMRGWAAMIRQMDVRGDRFPVPAPPNTLTEYLAVRLILERMAIAYVAREYLGYTGPLSGVREEAQKRITPASTHHIDQKTFCLFQLAQIQGWCPSALHALSKAQWTKLVSEVDAFSNVERRRVFQLALEHRFRTKALDAIATHTLHEPHRVEAPRFQAVFCIDAREESYRRHLEEICPEVETFGAAGFFTVPIYFRGVAEASFHPLCPIIVKPNHWLTEDPVYSLQETHRRRAQTRRLVGRASHGFNAGSRTFALGALLSGGLGLLASVPLVARVLFPRLTAQFERTANSILDPPQITRLVLERTCAHSGPEDEKQGFTLAEMIQFSERILRDISLTSRFARLVFVLGHRSHCLNNPHKAAYDCGACTGPGGANARALALMLNDHRVRKALADRGLEISEDTIFIGGYHNTAMDSIAFYDLDLLPRSHRADFEFAQQAMEKACDVNAHERCRRFDSAPLNISLAEARRHVENRAEDLAQVRPEFGNATNAMCIVGRRERSRGLFMDRRCFMHSYDPTQDDEDSSILARILSAVIPVCQGINLQYYFSSVDSPGWGCGTKLPHNVTSLLGVMDGAASDLRPGLPWQGVEIHEPLRVLFVIETTPEQMLKIMSRNPWIDRIVRNHWSQLALLNPESNELLLFRKDEFQRYDPANITLPKAKSSTDWYRGSRTFLDFAEITGALAPAADYNWGDKSTR